MNNSKLINNMLRRLNLLNKSAKALRKCEKVEGKWLDTFIQIGEETWPT